jgi:hypothetical protein
VVRCATLAHPLPSASHPHHTLTPQICALCVDPGYGYHVDDTRGIAKGNEPESIFAVMSGSRHTGADAAHKGCCFDYGNSENSVNAKNTSDGSGAMEAIYFGATNASIHIFSRDAICTKNDHFTKTGSGQTKT